MEIVLERHCKMMPVEISKGILQNAYIYQYPPTRVMQVFFFFSDDRTI